MEDQAPAIVYVIEYKLPRNAVAEPGCVGETTTGGRSMTKRSRKGTSHLLGRRDVLRRGVALGAAGLLGPRFVASAFAQPDDLAPYTAAKINWKQAEGEQITIAVIPASYFENLISLQPQFEALTGVKLRFEKVP